MAKIGTLLNVHFRYKTLTLRLSMREFFQRRSFSFLSLLLQEPRQPILQFPNNEINHAAVSLFSHKTDDPVLK